MTFRGTATGLCLSAALALLAGCASLDPDASVRLERYQQQVSSGFTGCEPADNVISSSSGMRYTAYNSWHATCKAKTYICTGVSTGPGTTYACAPVAQ